MTKKIDETWYKPNLPDRPLTDGRSCERPIFPCGVVEFALRAAAVEAGAYAGMVL